MSILSALIILLDSLNNNELNQLKEIIDDKLKIVNLENEKKDNDNVVKETELNTSTNDDSNWTEKDDEYIKNRLLELEKEILELDLNSNGSKDDYLTTINAIKEECHMIELKYSNEGDGRITSAIKENEYLSTLQKGLKLNYPSFDIEIPKERYWYDIKINNIPINLKITTGGTDNAFNKSAILFTITGKEPEKHNMNYNMWFNTIMTSKQKEIRDKKTEYHYLVVDKNSKRIILKSILDIHTYKSNPSNDLQINWNNEFENKDYNCENFKEKMKSLLTTVQVSVKKMISNINKFAEADLNEYFK
jgi:hypothetical protein